MASKCFAIWFYCYWVILATALIDAQYDGKKCSKEGASGRDCRGILKPVGIILSRAGGILCGSYLCERHRYRVLQEDNTRCSCPSSWGHSKYLHLHPILGRLFQIFDSLGRTREGYILRRGGAICAKRSQTKSLSPWRAFKKVHQESETL